MLEIVFSSQPVRDPILAHFFLYSLPYKCHCEAVCAEAISCFTGIAGQKRIATPPRLPWRAVPGKSKSGGSQ
jgi:hypothetical protein